MMPLIYDGGEAFPLNILDQGDSGNLLSVEVSRGMTLRDWFAGQAIARLTYHSVEPSPAVYSHVARECVRFADALLAELRKGVSDGA